MKHPNVFLTSLALTALCASCQSSDDGSSSGSGGAGGGDVPELFSVFISDRSDANRPLPYLVDLQSGDVTALGAGIPAGAEIYEFGTELSPDGRYLAYTTLEGNTARFSVMSTANGSIVTLPFSSQESPPGERGEGLSPGLFRFSPDSSRILFTYRESPSFELRTHLLDADGSNPVQIDANSEHVDGSGWTADSSKFFTVSRDPISFDEEVVLHSVDQTMRTPLSSAPGAFIDVNDFSMSPDGGTVAFLLDYEDSSLNNYDHVGAANVLSGTNVLFAVDDADEFIQVSSDGGFVAFTTYGGSNGPVEVVIGDVTTGSSMVVNAPIMNMDASINDMAWEPGGTRLAYIADHVDDSTDELFVTDSTANVINVHPGMSAGSDIEEFAWSPSGRYLAYVLDEDKSSSDVLHVYDADSGQPATEISNSSVTNDVRRLRWSPDGDWLIAQARDNGQRRMVRAYSRLNAWTSSDLGEGWSGADDTTSSGAPTARCMVFEDGLGVLWTREGAGEEELVLGDLSDPTATRVVSQPPAAGAPGNIYLAFGRSQPVLPGEQ